MPDDGNPKNYSFFVHDNGQASDNISVIVWPTDSDDSYHGDQELQWQHEDFDQIMEATYLYCGEKELSKAKIHDLLIKIGLTYGEQEAIDCNTTNPDAYIPPKKTPSVKKSGNKLSTEQLKKLIVTNIMPQWVAGSKPECEYLEEDHSMDDCLNISKWKRMSKRKITESSEIDMYSLEELKTMIKTNARMDLGDVVVLDTTKCNEKHYIQRVFHFDPDNIDYFGVAFYTDAADENIVMYEIVQD